jgi:hypothetical protein
MLTLTVDPGVSASREAAEACRELYMELRIGLNEGQVSLVPVGVMSTQRSMGLEFGNLILTGINLGVFAALYQMIKTFLENRPTAEVTIKSVDGRFEFKASKVPLKRAAEMYQQYLAITPNIAVVVDKTPAKEP